MGCPDDFVFGSDSYIWYALNCLTYGGVMVSGGLAFLGTGCTTPDVGLDYIINMCQMLNKIDTMKIYYSNYYYVSGMTHLSHHMFLAHTLFENTRMNLSYGTHLYRVHIPTSVFCRGASGFVTVCSCGVWGCGWTTCPLHVVPFCGKSILNKLVCRLDIKKNTFYSLYRLYTDDICWYIALVSCFCLLVLISPSGRFPELCHRDCNTFGLITFSCELSL